MKTQTKRDKFLFLLILSISTAIFCGIWAFLAPLIGLIGWAGFAGCTTYFSTGCHGWQGLRRTLIPNIAGVLCGLAIIGLNTLTPALENLGIWCGVITFVMCIISYFKLFDFCPGIFMGCFCTFAAGADRKLLIPSLIVGAFLGLACDKGGVLLHKLFIMGNKH